MLKIKGPREGCRSAFRRTPRQSSLLEVTNVLKDSKPLIGKKSYSETASLFCADDERLTS